MLFARDPGRRQRLGEHTDSRPSAEALIVFAVAGEKDERNGAGLRDFSDRFARLQAELEIEHREIGHRNGQRRERRRDIGGGRHDGTKVLQACFKVEADQRIVFHKQDAQAP